MIRIDENKIFEVIQQRRPKTVALNGPEALFPKIQDAADHIVERFGIETYVIGDTCWGSCDLNTHAADLLGAEILFNVGHTVAMETFGKKVVMINAFDDVNFESVARTCARELMAEYKCVSLVTNSQHLAQIEQVRKIFEEFDYTVILGRGKGQLNDAQVFGCEFYPVYNVQQSIDAYIFLGQSMFHAASIAMSTEKPTFMLDPYFQEYKQVNDFAENLKRRAILTIYKALDAERIAIIIGLKEGQFAKVRALQLKAELESLGKKIQLIGLTEITEERLQNFKNIDAFIQVACPRISTDNHFGKPVLSVPQAHALMRLLKKEPVEDFLKLQHWL